MMKRLCIMLLPLLLAIPSRAVELALPSVFSDHMVLQRERPVPVWGKADPDATVTVGFAGQAKTAVAKDDGTWQVDLEPMPASSDPGMLTVRSGDNEVVFHDVLVGEVWLCSGQSNMQWPMEHSENADAAIAAASHPQIRLFHTPKVCSESPLEKIDAQWETCTPETVGGFSAVAYYFGRKLHQDLDVPVGLLLSAWGGTRIEPWTPPCGFEGIESLADIHQLVQESLPGSPCYKKALAGDQQTPTKLYNGMLHAHIPFAIRGAIWYQGESNRDEGMLYVDKTKALLNGWHKLWGYDFPFYFVQIAPFQYGGENPEILPLFWEAQSEIVKTLPKTGMAVVSDYTTLENIHPPNKEIPGTRLALLAEANDYGMDVVCNGPVFESLEKLEGRLKVVFDSAEGLTTSDGKTPDWFEVAGKDGVFKKADATIIGNAVVIHSDEVAEPVAVRFAWHKLATPNLMNGAGLPAAAFRAGQIPSS